MTAVNGVAIFSNLMLDQATPANTCTLTAAACRLCLLQHDYRDRRGGDAT